MFQGDDLAEAMGVPLFYGIVEAILLGVYCVMSWKLDWTKAPASDPFFQIISMSYEVFSAEEENDSKNHEFHIKSPRQNEGGDCQYIHHHLEEKNDSERKKDGTRINTNSTENTNSENEKRRRTFFRPLKRDKKGEALIEVVETKGGTMA